MTPDHLPVHADPDNNDYHHLPVTDKQLRFARQIARGLGTPLPDDVQQDRRAISSWIEAHRALAIRQAGRFAAYPTSKQVAFAERIARLKRRPVPPECFRDRTMLSRWIDSNL